MPPDLNPGDQYRLIFVTINVSPYNDPEGIAWRVCNSGAVQAAGGCALNREMIGHSEG